MVIDAPLVSVLMPVYNAEPYLAAAIRSIVSQTFDDFEVIAVNDGSTDESQSILESFAGRDPRVRLFSQPNRGYTHALNRALGEARGSLLARHDADDLSTERRFARQVDFLAQDRDVGVVGSSIECIDRLGNALSRVDYPASDSLIRAAQVEKHDPCMAHSSVVMRAHLIREAGGYRPAMEPAEDYDLWLRLSERCKLANIRQPLVQYRVHDGQVSQTRAREQVIAGLAARGCAVERRKGSCDPLGGRGVADELFLEEISSDEIAYAVAGALVSRGYSHLKMGRVEDAVGKGEAALGEVRGRPLHRKTISDIEWNVGRLWWRASRFARASRVLADSVRRMPSQLPARVVARATRVLRDLVPHEGSEKRARELTLEAGVDSGEGLEPPDPT